MVGFDGFGNGMVAFLFQTGGIVQHPLLFHAEGVALLYGERAAGQRAGLVEDDRLRFGQRLHVVASFGHDARPGKGTDAAEVGQRDGDDQRAGAADDQEGQGAVDPDGRLVSEKRPDEGKQGGPGDHGRSVDAGESGDELLALRLAGRGILHHLHDFADRRVLVGLHDLDLDDAGGVHRAADNRVSDSGMAGYRLSGDALRVQIRVAFDDDSVKRNFLAVLHLDDLADLHFLARNRMFSCFVDDGGAVALEVEHAGDIPAGRIDRLVLEVFADLIEQHDRCGFPEVGKHDGSDRGDRHEEVLVQHLSLRKIP